MHQRFTGGLAVAVGAIGIAFLTSLPGELAANPESRGANDPAHDFDFEFGSWKTHLRRLQHPLSGSTTWVEYDGTTIVHPISGGRANVVDLDVSGSAGAIAGLSLRLYEPEGRQWTLNFVSFRDGRLTAPVIGSFRDARGTFYGQDSLNGRAILVRFVITRTGPHAVHFEQAFSQDGAQTWEINWIADDTRSPRPR